MNNLKGKTALVTGASRGIGRATALALAQAGAQVLVHYGKGAAEADAVVAEIRKIGGRAESIPADLAATDGPRKLATRVREVVGERLDILVANAGISMSASIEDTTVEDFDRLFAVNVRAPFFLVQKLLPILGQGSSVVLVSSLAANASVGALPAYAATKGAISTLVVHFAAALGARGIRVNAVAPGVVETDMSSFAKTDAGRDFTLAMQAIKRVAQPDDIAAAISFLASDDARWVTGDVLRVDGGSKTVSGLANPTIKEQSMTGKTPKLPGPDHPISVERNQARVVVKFAGRVVADTREALTLREARYGPVQYIPRKDVDMSLLERSEHATYCPYKGDCSYYSIFAGGQRAENAVWTYEAPYAAVSGIREYLAFYPERVDSIEESAA